MTQEFKNDLRMGRGQNKMFTGFEKDLIEILQRGGKIRAIRDQYANNMSDVKVYTRDCLFPYTMYVFNMYDPINSKMYIWINNLFAYSNNRDGFVIEGRFEQEHMEKYKHQYEQAIEAAIKAQGEQISILNTCQNLNPQVSDNSK